MEVFYDLSDLIKYLADSTDAQLLARNRLSELLKGLTIGSYCYSHVRVPNCLRKLLSFALALRFFSRLNFRGLLFFSFVFNRIFFLRRGCNLLVNNWLILLVDGSLVQVEAGMLCLSFVFYLNFLATN